MTVFGPFLAGVPEHTFIFLIGPSSPVHRFYFYSSLSGDLLVSPTAVSLTIHFLQAPVPQPAEELSPTFMEPEAKPTQGSHSLLSPFKTKNYNENVSSTDYLPGTVLNIG